MKFVELNFVGKFFMLPPFANPQYHWKRNLGAQPCAFVWFGALPTSYVAPPAFVILYMLSFASRFAIHGLAHSL